MIPTPAALLTPDQVEQVHDAALEILETVGVRVGNERASAIFVRHGCTLDSDSGIVTLPRAVVEHFIAAFPGTFTFYGREPQYDRTLPDDGPLFTTTSAAPNVIDLETGQERLARSADIARLAKCVQKLSGYDAFTISITADDAPVGQITPSRIFSASNHCLKPIIVGGPQLEEYDTVFGLCEMLAGGREDFLARPFVTFLYSLLISPLVMEENYTESYLGLIEMGLAPYTIMAPTAGLTAPFSLLGTLAQTTAEFLATAILAQMVRAETPVMFGALPIAADLRMAAYASGGIETGILLMGCAQMARRYGVPSVGYTGATNAKLVDAQSGIETGMNSLAAMLAGIGLIHMGGLLDALMALDFAKLLVDHETALMLKHTWRGFEQGRDALAVEAIAEAGPGGAFIDAEHTIQRIRTTAFLPQIADRSRRDVWEADGGQDAHARASQLVRDLLKHDSPGLISPDLDAQIRTEFVGIVSGEVP